MNKSLKKIAFIIHLIIFFICSALIVYFSLSNGDESSQQSGFFSKIVISISEWITNRSLSVYEIEVIHFEMRKFIGHFTLFLLDGLSLFACLDYLIDKKKSIIICLIFGLLLASSSEICQIFAGGRSSQFHDVILDYSGFVFPIVVLLILAKQNNKS